MRKDAIGFFWEDIPVVKERKVKEVIKRTPPEPVWLKDDYLPHLQEALNANFNLYTEQELINAFVTREPLVFDIECYKNYFLIAFMGVNSKKIIYFEMDESTALNVVMLKWIVTNFTIISFNGKHYDEPILTMALHGFNNMSLKEATNFIISENWRPWEILRNYGLKRIDCDHIDIKEVMPGVGVGLKLYGARMHAKQLQDLPFHPEALLNYNQKSIIRWYCVNDLDLTDMAYKAVKPDIDLRIDIGNQHGIDVRSRSDAQVAEDVITAEYRALTGRYPPKPRIEDVIGQVLTYDIPEWLHFQTPLMNSVLDLIRGCKFVIGHDGKIINPPELKGLQFVMGGVTYRMGIGGLHSCEKNLVRLPTKGKKRKDADVTSYYPETILGQKLFPPQLGEVFLQIYENIVNVRIAAKKAGEKRKSDSLKITINGAYGKFGSLFSFLYAPKLLLQTTLTGQLALLMLCELLELNGASIVSANTDGIVIEYDEDKEDFVNSIISYWEGQSKFDMEYTEYKSLHSSNVNNYIAIMADGKIKRKGWFREAGLTKNSTGSIITDAVVEYLDKGTPIRETIKNCTDIRKFVAIRQVRGGAVWNGEYLGGVVRWYISNKEDVPEMIYAKSGNKVAGSTNGVPLMKMEDIIPEDLDYEHYITKSESYLQDFGYM